MRQHVISAWLLRAFANRIGGNDVVSSYDKTTDRIDSSPTDEFLTEDDAHPAAIEAAFSAVESRAASAARTLAKRVRGLRPGMYAIVEELSPPEFYDLPSEIEYGGMRLTHTGLELIAPSQRDRLALAENIGLMYQRAPRLEKAMLAWGRAYDRGAQDALDVLAPGARTGLQTEITNGRSRFMDRARNIGGTLAGAHWWVVRARPETPFVLGDSPVVSTIALGHDDEFRAILADTSFVVAMPIGPALALVIAPQKVLPYAKPIGDVGAEINRLSWRSAQRYVLGQDSAVLESAMAGIGKSERQSTVPANVGTTRS
jgi:hypothetical protein